MNKTEYWNKFWQSERGIKKVQEYPLKYTAIRQFYADNNFKVTLAQFLARFPPHTPRIKQLVKKSPCYIGRNFSVREINARYVPQRFRNSYRNKGY